MKNTSGAFSIIEFYGHVSLIQDICKEAISCEGQSPEVDMSRLI
jgi:hypothetical protein